MPRNNILGSMANSVLLAGLVVVGAMGVPSDGQEGSRAKPAIKPAVVSGRVFAITGSGDLKPARMADVYLFYAYRSVRFAETHKDSDSAGMSWENNYLKMLEKESSEESSEDDSESQLCHRRLRVYDAALLQTLDWASAHKKSWQVIIGQADEEGRFRATVPNPGEYILVARGRAGFNEAVWQLDLSLITIGPGVEVSVKADSPKQACLEIGG